MMGMQPHAAMRCWSPQSMDRVAAVDRVAIVEEDGIRHRRVVIGAGEPVALQSLRSVDAVGGCRLIAAGRDGPDIAHVAVLDDQHALRRLIDKNVEPCLGAFDADEPCQRRGEDDDTATHDELHRFLLLRLRQMNPGAFLAKMGPGIRAQAGLPTETPQTAYMTGS